MKIWIFIYYFNGTASAVPFLFIGGRFDYNAEQGEGVTHTLVRKGADYLTLTIEDVEEQVNTSEYNLWL